MARELLRIGQRHPLRRIVLLDVERHQIIAARFGEVDEIVGLVDRIAGPGEMIGAPFEAERLGHRRARLKQFARHRMALEQRLAEATSVSSPEQA